MNGTMKKCLTCDNRIAYPTQSCKMRLLGKGCDYRELYRAPKKEDKNGKTRRKKQKRGNVDREPILGSSSFSLEAEVPMVVAAEASKAKGAKG